MKLILLFTIEKIKAVLEGQNGYDQRSDKKAPVITGNSKLRFIQI